MLHKDRRGTVPLEVVCVCVWTYISVYVYTCLSTGFCIYIQIHLYVCVHIIYSGVHLRIRASTAEMGSLTEHFVGVAVRV